MFDISSRIITYNTSDLVIVLVLGLTGGLLGALFNYLVDKVLRMYSIINEYASLSLSQRHQCSTKPLSTEKP